MQLKTLATMLVSATLGTGLSAQRPPTTPAAILQLARTGHATEAWQAWAALPSSPDQLRLGVRLAVETKQLARGVDLYGTLVAKTQAPDRQALTDLALGAAAELAASADIDVRVNACGAALTLDKNHRPCRAALEAIANTSAEVDEQALAIYAMANAGVKPWPERVDVLASTSSKQVRLQLAMKMTRLTPAERLALLKPLLEDLDRMIRYAALQVAADVPGDDMLAALRYVQGGTLNLTGESKTALTLALARHGDPASLDAVRQSFSLFTGADKVNAGRTLAAVFDKEGVEALNQMLESLVDVERLQAAEALKNINPLSARQVLINSIVNGSAGIREAAILAAGRFGLGAQPEIYRKLLDPTPLFRAAAVDAIATTFYLEDHRPRPAGLQ